ncbi:MAG: hypothetical protein ACOYKQ_10660, partial [Polymorphobacter sp.]
GIFGSTDGHAGSPFAGIVAAANAAVDGISAGLYVPLPPLPAAATGAGHLAKRAPGFHKYAP